MRRLLLACRSFLYGGAFVWLWLAIAFRVSSWRLGPERSAWPANVGIAGVILMAAGGMLGVWCVALFVVRGSGTPAPFDAPRTFVAAGPYRYVRNPMYWGGCSALVGLALYRRSLPMLVFCVLWFLLAHLFVVYYEEPTLLRKFGVTYADYCRHVRRWLPRVPAASRRTAGGPR